MLVEEKNLVGSPHEANKKQGRIIIDIIEHRICFSTLKVSYIFIINGVKYEKIGLK